MAERLRLCPYCTADPEGDLEACLRALNACNNCRADLLCRGDWTGDGLRAVKRLVERHGVETVIAAEARLKKAPRG